MADHTRQPVFGSTDTQHYGVGSARKRRHPVGAGRPAGRLRSSLGKEADSPPPLKEQVPETPLLCLSVAVARSNLVVVTASVKGYQEPMIVLIDSGASFDFSTKASVVRDSTLYASALEASHGNTDVSVRLATGSIVSTRKDVLPFKVKFDDFDSVEPFIVLDMDDRYDLILGMPWLAKHEPWINWRSRTIGASHKPLADRALVGHAPSSSRDGFVYEHRFPRGEQHIVGTSEVLTTPSTYSPRALELGDDGTQDSQTLSPTPVGIQGPAGSNRVARAPGDVDSSGANAARSCAGRGGSVQASPQHAILVGSAHGDGGAGVDTRAEDGGRIGTPITQGVGAGSAHAGKCAVAGSAHADVRAGVGAPADNSGRVGAPTMQGVIAGSARAKGRGEHGFCAPKDETLRVLDVLTGKPKVGVMLAPLPSVAELLELEELSYLDFLESLKAGGVRRGCPRSG
ncbi:unnamed protein product [Phytophthora fragariaefolia]|uniref:Unnamed protein product n=1 Tax=Phytophthora fragariaefolia TaxID=1490495 RepID=A0A9W6Y473_9STRA|nr:unnamed protein product [Phytophthora fragariaefolia]